MLIPSRNNPPPTLLIVNADDLGASVPVNEAIFDLLEAERLTSATILANGPAFTHACKYLPLFPRCSFGIHLNLTEFSPLTSDTNLRVILNTHGRFAGESTLRKARITRSLAHAIYAEFSAQIDRLQSAGIQISHIDSHQHIHTMPQLFPVLKSLQRRYRLRKVRISRNIYLDDLRPSRLILLQKYAFNFTLRHLYRSWTTEGFTDFTTFWQYMKNGGLPQTSVEVMVHPGAVASQPETVLLRSSWKDDFASALTLISYNDL